MKILTLNKHQQEKLIKLCKQFFPELQEKADKLGVEWGRKHGFEDEYGFRLSDQKHNTKVYCSYPIDYDYHNHLFEVNKELGIHWYQLCLTELPKRIVERLSTNCYFSESEFHKEYMTETGFGAKDLAFLLSQADHPIDRLWKFVQECKKQKYFKK